MSPPLHLCLKCNGRIGPDIHGHPMCYGCGPLNVMPDDEKQLLTNAERFKREREWQQVLH